MATDISGFGLQVQILASNTFPIPGITLTEFADDGDPIDSAATDIANVAMGLNGNLIRWTVANPIPLVMNFVAGSEDETLMSLLFEANRAGANKKSSKDVIMIVISYPDGSTTTLIGGVCLSFMPTKGVSSEGRLKTMAYTLAFENKISVPAL